MRFLESGHSYSDGRSYSDRQNYSGRTYSDRHNIADSLTPFTQTDKHITDILTLMGKLFRGLLVYHRQKNKKKVKIYC